MLEIEAVVCVEYMFVFTLLLILLNEVTMTVKGSEWAFTKYCSAKHSNAQHANMTHFHWQSFSLLSTTLFSLALSQRENVYRKLITPKCLWC